MKCVLASYIPPPHKPGADVYYENLMQFKTTHPLRLFSDHEPYGLRKIGNPAPYRNPKKPFVISNLIFLCALADAIDQGVDYMLYLEDDCRVMGDEWDRAMFDDYSSTPNALFGGSPFCYHPMSSGCHALKRLTEFAWSYYKWVGIPMPIIGEAGGFCFFPNGALAIYHIPSIAPHFGDFQKNKSQWALTHEAWDMHIGRSLFAQYGVALFERFAPIKSAYSGYGNKLFIEEERKSMLLSGQIRAVHQIKDVKWQPTTNQRIKIVSLPVNSKPKPVPSILYQTPWKCGFFEFKNPENVFQYNPSFVVTDAGEMLLATRCEQFTSWAPIRRSNTLVIWNLDQNKRASEPRQLQFQTGVAGHNYEDPRLLWNDGLWVSYYHYQIRRELAHQELAQVAGNSLTHIYHPVYGKNVANMGAQTWHEKNWVWFIHEGELCCVYLIAPEHTVFKYDGQSVTDKWITASKLPWAMGQARGGSPPVRVGDEYFCFFHSSLPWEGHPPQNRYYMGAYAFKAGSPFQITRMSRLPLLTGSEADPMRRYSPPCVFPGGAALDGDDWFVVLGVNDCACAWISIPREELLKTMEEVS